MLANNAYAKAVQKKRRNLKRSSAYDSESEKERIEDLQITAGALSLVIGYYLVGIVAYSYNIKPHHDVCTAVYFSTETMCTLGFGNLKPASTPKARVFTLFFCLLGVGCAAVALAKVLDFAEQKRSAALGAAKRRLIRAATGTGGQPSSEQVKAQETQEGRLQAGLHAGGGLGERNPLTSAAAAAAAGQAGTSAGGKNSPRQARHDAAGAPSCLSLAGCGPLGWLRWLFYARLPLLGCALNTSALALATALLYAKVEVTSHLSSARE